MLLDHVRHCALLRLLQPRTESALVQEIEFRGIFREAHLKSRNFLEPQLAMDFQTLLGHLAPLHASVLFHFPLQQVSDVRVVQFRPRLQRQEFWRVRCNHRPANVTLHHANPLGSSQLSWQLRLVYPVGEVGAVIQQSNLVRALNLLALNLICAAPSLYVCGALKHQRLLQ